MAPRKGMTKRERNSGRDGQRRDGGRHNGGKADSSLGVNSISRTLQKNVMGSAQSVGKCFKKAYDAASWLGLDLSNFMYGPILYGKHKQGQELLFGPETYAGGSEGGEGGDVLSGQGEQGVDDGTHGRPKSQLRPHARGLEKKGQGKNKIQEGVREAGVVIKESVVVEKQVREKLGFGQPDAGPLGAADEGNEGGVEIGDRMEVEGVSQAIPSQHVQVVVASTQVQAKLSVELSGGEATSSQNQMEEELSPTPPEWKRAAKPHEKGLLTASDRTPSSRGYRVSSAEIDDEASDATPHRIVYAATALDPDAAVEVAKKLVEGVGGRHSVELGIHLEAGDAEAEKWFLAALLFKNRLAHDNVVPIYKRLTDAGLRTLMDVAEWKSDELSHLLTKEGFSWRTNARLKRSAREMRARIGSSITVLKDVADAKEVEEKLQSLEGVGPVTCHLFLRELRGIWAANVQAYSASAISVAHHLHLISGGEGLGDSHLSPMSGLFKRWQTQLDEIAHAAGIDARDLSVALSRLDARHGREFASCPGGQQCRGYKKGTSVKSH